MSSDFFCSVKRVFGFVLTRKGTQYLLFPFPPALMVWFFAIGNETEKKGRSRQRKEKNKDTLGKTRGTHTGHSC